MRILLTEDDVELADATRAFLQRQGEEVDISTTAFQALDAALSNAYDVLVVDMMLPDGDGVDVIAELRRLHCLTPALVLTARNETIDRIRGLNAGADDYLGKPFDPEELAARIRALVRRATNQTQSDVISAGSVRLHLKSRTLDAGRKQLELSSKEFLLLEYLLRHPGQVLSRHVLVNHLWGPDAEVADNALDTYIYFLRKKCTQLGLRSFIKTVRGQGYMVKIGQS